MSPVRAQARSEGKTPAANRPGDALYTPSKLEWAALELEVDAGSSQPTVGTHFLRSDDGKTVVCMLLFTSGVAAETIKGYRERAQLKFESYAKNRGWSWLRLQFREEVLPSPKQSSSSGTLRSSLGDSRKGFRG